MTQIVDTVNGTITRTYDGLDRLTSETTPKGSVSYTYDNANRRSTMTVAGQSAVSYTYDNANRLTQISQGTATMTIGYDNANRRTSLTFPKRVAAAYGYDAASRVTSITYTERSNTIGTLTYTYDPNGRRASMGGSLAKVNLPAAVTSAIYNADNQLTNWNGTTLSYDLNGNLTSDGATAYTWDARNRLAAFGSTTFTYDSFGRRTRNATGKAFLYDGANAVQELSGSTVTANLLTGFGVDEIFTRTDSAGARYFLPDALGSTLALTDSNGAVQTQYSYEPFGKTTTTGASNSSTFQYTGRENDGTGLYYYRARYYNANLQRFISEDPLRFSGGDANFYVYTGNDPVNFGDPNGESRYDKCQDPDNFKRFVGDLLSWLAQATGKTWGLGGGGSAGAGVTPIGINFGISHLLVASPDGSVGTALTMTNFARPWGLGMGSWKKGGLGFIGGLQGMVSGARTIGDLSGKSIDAGVSLADGLGVGGDFSYGTTWDVTLTVGGGVGGKAVAGSVTDTAVVPFCK